jgi:ATP-dependent Zn protease
MPEIARFLGIVIRMFAEPAAPHHRTLFTPYHQEDPGILAIDAIDLIGGTCRAGSGDSWRHGRRFIRMNLAPLE